MQLDSSIEKCTQGNFLSKIVHCNAKIHKNECEWKKSTMGVCIFMASVTESLRHMGSSGKWRCVKNPGVSPVVDCSSTKFFVLSVLSVLKGAVLLSSTIRCFYRPRRSKHLSFASFPVGCLKNIGHYPHTYLGCRSHFVDVVKGRGDGTALSLWVTYTVFQIYGKFLWPSLIWHYISISIS